MQLTKFIVVGGFLGAGKTTLLARWAHYYQQQGRRVGLVTNDQAAGLVDTYTLRQQGFAVGEVSGACFCCKFHDLVNVAHQLTETTRPDVVFAEPVGSCTDIQATVIEPLRHLHQDRYVLAPFVVLLKPEHGQKILSGRGPQGFSPQAAYIFLKQLEEADMVAINKIDKLTDEQLEDLFRWVGERVGPKPLFAISARTGTGCTELFDQVEQVVPPGDACVPLDIDYDTYAEGEAELGWLNAEAVVAREQPFAMDDVLLGFLTELAHRLASAQLEPAHLKVYAESGTDAALANWVSSDVPPELSVSSQANVTKALVVVNARVVAPPETLETILRQALQMLADEWKATATWLRLQRFRPARPQPTIRWAQPNERCHLQSNSNSDGKRLANKATHC